MRSRITKLYILKQEDVAHYYELHKYQGKLNQVKIRRMGVAMQEWIAERQAQHYIFTCDGLLHFMVGFYDDALEAEFILRFGHDGIRGTK